MIETLRSARGARGACRVRCARGAPRGPSVRVRTCGRARGRWFRGRGRCPAPVG